jgi:hypothetical protein
VQCRVQNSWEEIFDVMIPWNMIYELVHKMTIRFEGKTQMQTMLEQQGRKTTGQ